MLSAPAPAATPTFGSWPPQVGFVAKLVPVDLVCPKCSKLFTGPLLLPCCGESLCRPCADAALRDSSESQCPLCQQKVSSRRLCANFALSRAVESFRYMQGHQWPQVYTPQATAPQPIPNGKGGKNGGTLASKTPIGRPTAPKPAPQQPQSHPLLQHSQSAPTRPSPFLVPFAGFGGVPPSKLKPDAPEFVPVSSPQQIPVQPAGGRRPTSVQQQRSPSCSPPGGPVRAGPSTSLGSLSSFASELSASLSESPPDNEPLDLDAVCRSNQAVKASMLVRVLARCGTIEELDALLAVLEKSPHVTLPTNGEIGTLVVKAACRTCVPERAYTLFAEGRIRPTLGGVHYLMIHFSIKNNTPLILKIFEIARQHGMRPNVNTFHILIRACVNHNMIDQALKFAAECMSQNIRPNRVVFNLLMKGCYKANQPYQILSLRQQMDEQCRMEINDTTVKFTVMAYIMLDKTEKALEELLTYASGDMTKLEDVCLKFFEMSDGDNIEHFHLLALFHALREAEIQLPPSVEHQLSLFHMTGHAQRSDR